MRKQQPEYELQVAVCDWLRLKYPSVMFMTDTIAAIKLTPGQARRNKKVQKSGFHCPDLLIFASRGGYSGLFIELKAETPYRKDGTLKRDDHLEAQAATIEALNNEGYWACFMWDFERITSLIVDYLNRKDNF
jgi:hypothetical protein